MAGLLGSPPDLPRACRNRPVPAEVLRSGHVPLPQRRWAARRPSRGVYGIGHHRPVQAHAGLQRAAPHRLGRLRAARGAVRAAHRHPSADHHRTQRGALSEPAQVAGLLLRLEPGDQYHRSGLLPVDPVDLQAALRARPGVPGGKTGVVVSGAGYHAGQRGSHRRQVRGGRFSLRSPTAAAVGIADHRLRRGAARRAGQPGLAGQHQGDAAQLDRPQRRRRAGVPTGRRR